MPQSLEQARADTDSSIAAAIAHEVNNLLAPVIGLADLLEHSGGDPAVRDKLIERAVERCQRAVSICGMLVDLAKNAEPGPPSCALADAIRSAVETVAGPAEQSSVRIESGFNEPGRVAVPMIAAEHLLLNLLLNAVAASSPGDRVRVEARYRPSSRWRRAAWLIDVADTGRGLPPRSVESINRGGLPVGSTGIGLAVVRLLCQRWGGSLKVESRAGEGTTFHVELPAA